MEKGKENKVWKWFCTPATSAGPLLPRSNCIIHHTFISSVEKWGKNHFHHHLQNW